MKMARFLESGESTNTIYEALLDLYCNLFKEAVYSVELDELNDKRTYDKLSEIELALKVNYLVIIYKEEENFFMKK